MQCVPEPGRWLELNYGQKERMISHSPGKHGKVIDHTCLPLHLKGALSHMHPGSGSASSTCKLAPASLTSYLVSKSVWLRGTPTGLCLLTALDNHQPHTQPCPCSSAAFPVLCFPYLFAPSSISLYIVFVVCLLLLECKLHAGRALCFVHYGIPSAY